jgi:fructose-1,6-bisphosphatase/inositol monophosphatase family enzyme
MLPDSERVARLIAETAAAEIMPRFRHLEREEIREKGPGDLVTTADLAAEQRLGAALHDLLPGSCVVGEEGVAADPALLSALDGSDPVWLVDPIDGTGNFAAGRPVFATMVALVRCGSTLMGWIHDPVSGLTASASAGEGAWRAGRRLHVATAPLPGADGSTGIWRGNRRLGRRLAKRPDLVSAVFDLRCAGQEYLALAEGTAHFALYNKLNPWDHAAGQLLHREAGGSSALLDGTPYAPRPGATGLLLAPDATSWETLRRCLIESG